LAPLRSPGSRNWRRERKVSELIGTTTLVKKYPGMRVTSADTRSAGYVVWGIGSSFSISTSAPSKSFQRLDRPNVLTSTEQAIVGGMWNCTGTIPSAAQLTATRSESSCESTGKWCSCIVAKKVPLILKTMSMSFCMRTSLRLSIVCSSAVGKSSWRANQPAPGRSVCAGN
jgi:hypothetical protein